MQDVLRGRPVSCGSSSSTLSGAAAAAAAAGGWDGSSEQAAWPPHEKQQQQQVEGDLVGEGEDADESSLHQHSSCAAPDDARPSSYGGISSSSGAVPGCYDDDSSLLRHQQQWGETLSLASSSSAAAAGPGPSSLAAAAAAAGAAGVLDRDAALVVYRAGPGSDLARVLNDNHSRLKGAKRRRQQLSEELNGLKGRLDGLLGQQQELKQRRLQRGVGVMTGGGGEGELEEALAAAQVSLKGVCWGVLWACFCKDLGWFH